MRAVVHDRYGPPDVLRIAEVEKPVPSEDEILIRIRATTVNRSSHGRCAGSFQPGGISMRFGLTKCVA